MKKIIRNMLAVLFFAAIFCLSGCSDSDESNGETEIGSGSQNGEQKKDESDDEKVLNAEATEYLLKAGDSKELTLTDISLAASKTLKMDGGATWTVENPYICSISSSGKLTPLSGGETVVTGTLSSDSTKKAVLKVKIAEPNREVSSDPFDLRTISENIDIFCCGDSIMRDYSASDSDQYGLGQALKEFFDETKANVVTDIANGGRSSRLFYNEDSRWPEVKRRIEANNKAGKKSVVILSFGHNDQRALTDCDKTYGAQFTFASENANGTVAGTHYDFMEKYIVETRELGAVPICVTPFVRANYSGSEVSAYGKHDWSNKTMTGDSTPRGNYPAAMKAAAKKQGAILVDMTELSAVRVAEYNNAGKEKYFYVDSDNTHERTLGGLELGKIVTDELKKNGYLTSYIKDCSPRIMVDKSNLAFGRILANATKTTSFRISNFQNKSGTITVSAPSGFGLSLSDSGTFDSVLTIETNENFIGTEIFVKFSPTEVISYNGDMTVTHSSVTPDFGNTPAGTVDGSTLKIALSGAGKELSVSGTDFVVNWPMISGNQFSVAATSTSEDIVPAETKLNGLIKTSNKTIGTETYARVTIDNPGNVWPVNDTGAKMNDVYIEYKIPASGIDLTVNEISFDCCSSGGSYMAWSAYYSTNEDFSNPEPICEMKTAQKEVLCSNSVGGSKDSSDALGLPVENGKSLYIRVYPAYKDTNENAGRTFIISNVAVKGLIQ